MKYHDIHDSEECWRENKADRDLDRQQMMMLEMEEEQRNRFLNGEFMSGMSVDKSTLRAAKALDAALEAGRLKYKSPWDHSLSVPIRWNGDEPQKDPKSTMREFVKSLSDDKDEDKLPDIEIANIGGFQVLKEGDSISELKAKLTDVRMSFASLLGDVAKLRDNISENSLSKEEQLEAIDAMLKEGQE